ncbi:extracellular solute-binding protein [Microbacterium sp. ISL-59]|uniref:extracellular solute-binding protein n=1 Tax=Microbacterium sp. ISL-59 TaxID=2819159 RepID=UPI001BE97516|nr:extracellular solute-binding protein [Microbacterium sp. ISL-59]MBT2496686.1 extracellular solute-binding protein [Microbacterium sp. ISL-59]
MKATGPTPDLAGASSAEADAFFSYPAKLARSVSAVPGDGSTVNAMMLTYSPPASGADGNALWTAINKELGVNLELNLVPASEYAAKFATVMASTALPDSMLIMNTVSRARDFVKAKCADLTDFVSGDNIKKYPNLANIPTASWEAMGRIDGRIFGIPLTRPKLNTAQFHVNRTKLDALQVPADWSQQDFLDAMKALKKEGSYGFGIDSSTAYGAGYFAGAFGAPQGWKLNKGAFTSAYESDEYVAALEFARQMYSDGYYHPTSSSGSLNDIMNLYYNQEISSTVGNFFNFAGGTYVTRVGGAFQTDVAVPFGSDRTSWMGSGVYGFTAFKDAPAERIEMMLRLCDYLAAPYGTTEYELLNYGVEGVHFTRSDGGLTPTDLAKTENANSVPVKYMSCAPMIIQVADDRAATERAFAVQSQLVPAGISDPSVGLFSATAEKSGAALAQTMNDTAAGIISGRQSVADWAAAIADYKNSGGARIADEFAASLTANS